MIWGVDTVLWPDVRGAYMPWCGVGWSHAVNTHGTYRLRTVPMVQVRGEGYYPGTCLNCAAVMQDLCRLLFGNVDTLMPSARHVSSEDGIGTVAERKVVGPLLINVVLCTPRVFARTVKSYRAQAMMSVSPKPNGYLSFETRLYVHDRVSLSLLFVCTKEVCLIVVTMGIVPNKISAK